MTPKEKAKELVKKFLTVDFFVFDKEAAQCALISVENEYNAKIEAYNEMSEFCPDVASQAAIYAEFEKQEVIKEIEKL